MAGQISNWLFYHAGARVYEKVLGAWTLGGWWRWQQAALEAIPPGEPALELGCGTGRLLAQRLTQGPAVGIDMALPMLRVAHRRLQSRPRGAPVLAADGGRLPFPDACFGAAYSTGVLTAIPDIRPLLAELRRVVRPGGTLAFVEMMHPAQTTLQSRLAMAALRAARDEFHDIPALLGELGIAAADRELGRAGTVHLVTATLPPAA